MNNLARWLGVAALSLACAGGTKASDAKPDTPVVGDILLKGGTLIDGTGAARRQADVTIRGDRIVAVGTLSPGPNTEVVNIAGLIVAPGFIDLHTHSDESITKAKTRNNLNYQAQGVTTVVTGNCGGGELNVRQFLAAVDREGAGANVIHLVPLGAVRGAVMANADRKPDSVELSRMVDFVDQGMNAGAWGVSTGLIYLPGRYAETDEIIALAREAAWHGGFYASHIRDEGAGLLGSIEEALAIGKGAGIPVHLSHLKATGKANWGLVVPACQKLADARKAGQRVSADQYPYIASSTKLAAMVVPHWALKGNEADFGKIADEAGQGARLRRAIRSELTDRDGGASIRIARYAPKPARVGRDLASIAREEGIDPVELVIDIQRHGGAQAISFGMNEQDVRHVMRQEFVATASDGGAHAPNSGDQPHPRAYGTFPRKVRYALDDQIMTLEAAVRSSSGLPAEILRLPDRGVVRPGAFADLVVFDPATFRDASTFDRPTRYAPGVTYLYINGVAVIADGRPRKVLPGRALRLGKDGPADVVLNLGRIWTGDVERPWASAVAARAGEVVGVGSTDEMARFIGPKTRVITRPSAFGMPGLIDSHVHLVDLGAGQEAIDLRGVATLAEVARRVRERVAATPKGTWITGQNWDQSLWPGGAFPTADVLDAAAPDRPVWLHRVDGHAGWANTEAMRQAKIDSKSAAPPDGQILRDKDGQPTGVFIDGAMSLVTKAMPPSKKSDIERQILAAQEIALNAGLTGAHDAGLGRLEIDVLRDLDRAGKLKLRVYGMAALSAGNALEFVKKAPIQPGPSARFQLRAVKLFIDGAMGSRGGLLFEPYSDDPGNFGLTLFPPRKLEQVATEALRHGWQVCTHAIGDKGNALVLDAYAAARRAVPSATAPRWRIEHAQVVRKSDVARFKDLGVIASMQPSHAVDDMRWADARLGPGRVDGAYAWRWFLDAEVPLAFGSDAPVAVISPFYGFYCALTREDESGLPPGGWHPGQKMTVEETLRAFTAGSALAQFAEGRLGIIRSGMRADFTVVDRDPFTSSPREVLGTRVVATVIEGAIAAGEEVGK